MNTFKKTIIFLSIIFFLTSCQIGKDINSGSQELLEATTCKDMMTDYYPSPEVSVPTHNDFTKKHFHERIKEFRNNPLKNNEIIMIGDSLTEKFNWADVLNGDHAIRNRGISGDTSDGVLLRINEVSLSKPKTVFLMIGTNDLWSSNTPEKTVYNIKKIVTHIKCRSPSTNIFIQTVLPVSVETHLNLKVRKINELISIQDFQGNVSILDTYSLLVDAQGLLNSAYTVDGIHLNTGGYSVWVNLIKRVLNE